MFEFQNNSTVLFLIILFHNILYVLIIKIKTSLFIFYKRQYSKRNGIGYKNKTIISTMVIAIILAILSYIIVNVFLVIFINISLCNK